MALSCGIAKSTATAYIHDVADFSANMASQHNKLPSLQKLPALTSPVEAHNLVPYIDDFIVEKRPDS